MKSSSDIMNHLKVLNKKYKLDPFTLGMYWGYFRGINGYSKNCLSFFCRKIIGIENLPDRILDWFIQRYLFNLTELAKRIEDNEALQKIEFVRYEHERGEKK